MLSVAFDLRVSAVKSEENVKRELFVRADNLSFGYNQPPFRYNSELGVTDLCFIKQDYENNIDNRRF